MPIGIQFDNANRYRRYPFSGDADLSAIAKFPVDENDFNFPCVLPLDFFTAFRFVYVGKSSVSSVNLVRVKVDTSGNGRNRRVYLILSFDVFDKNGNKLKFSCKGSEFGSAAGYGDPAYANDFTITLGISFSSIRVDPFKYYFEHVHTLHDFDFSNCISIYAKADFISLYRLLSSLNLPANLNFDIGHKFEIECNIPFLPSTILSMKTPHVMSVLDDAGEAIKDKDVITLEAGFNTKLDVIPGANAILVSALKGGGAGYPSCESGLSNAFSDFNLKTINGISATPSGDISLSGGAGLVVEPIKGTNIINIYSETEDKQSLNCKLS